MTSEQAHASNGYGSGLCYSLALFLSHEANVKYAMGEAELLVTHGAVELEGSFKSDPVKAKSLAEELAAARWFFHAARHIRNLIIPSSLPEAMRLRLQHLKEKCRQWSLPSDRSQNANLHDIRWAIDEAKELIRQIDELHGIRTDREEPNRQARKEPGLVFRDD